MESTLSSVENFCSFTFYLSIGIFLASTYSTIYATLKLIVQGANGKEPLNPLATGDPRNVVKFKKYKPKVYIAIPSYNEDVIEDTLPKWFNQNYGNYDVFVLEDGSRSYGIIGDVVKRSYDYVDPVGKRREVFIEKILVNNGSQNRVLNEFYVIRRYCREGFKAGALNNFMHLVEEGVIKDLTGSEKPELLVIVDADHEPGGNPFVRLLIGKKLHETALTHGDIQRARKKLSKFEEFGREVLGLDEYRLEPELMNNPDSFVTRAVELIEYHRFLIPKLAVVQGYQNHLFRERSGLDLYVYSMHVLTQYALLFRTPRVKIELIKGGKRIVREVGSSLFKKMLYTKWRTVNTVADGDKLIRVYLSSHAIPIFTGSSGILVYDVASKYMFADGVFVKYSSLTEDWEFSIRLLKDGYFIFATHQIETWAKPPASTSVFLKQQYRWAHGTISDVRKHYSNVMKSRDLSLISKISFIVQAIYYFPNALWVYGVTPFVSTLLYLTNQGLFRLAAPLTIAYIMCGDIVPHLNTVKTVENKFKLLLSTLYYHLRTTTVLSKAVLNALKGVSPEWVVTLKSRDK